ncbi:methylcobamide--CoM methyltransferase [Synergistales bacterium]|nr:methylcobamide--CoM methyltransferase [Synergistales bacterium]
MNFVTREIMEEAGVFMPEAHSDPALMVKLASAASRAGCFENYGLPFCMTVEAEAMGAKVDLGTRVYEPRVTGYAIDTVSDWRKLKPLSRDGRVGVVLDAIASLRKDKQGVPIIGNLTGPISVCTSLIEPMVFYKELRKKKTDARDMADFVAEQLLWFGLEQLAAGADVIAISDPSGTGEILGPVNFAEYAVPALNHIVQGLKAAFPDAGSIVHICGQMKNAFGPLSDVTCDAVSFDALVNMSDAKKNLPGKAIMGNVSTYAIEFETPEKITSLTNLCMEQDVDIVSPACGMGNASPLANIRAMLRTVKKKGDS